MVRILWFTTMGARSAAWCYVDDIVEGVLLALVKPGAIGQALTFGNPRSVVTVYNLAREIVRLSGSSSKIRFEEVDRADVELRIPNVKKARELLGFNPAIDLEEGLLRTIDWYQKHVITQGAPAAAR